MIPKKAVLNFAALAAVVFASSVASAQDKNIEVTNLAAILKSNPREPDGGTAAIIASFRAGDNALGILVMSKNRLHHHDHQDHVLYVARGTGTARLEDASGKLVTRQIKPGDILNLPRGKKHGFEKTGKDDLVFLVVAGPGADSPEDTTYHE